MCPKPEWGIMGFVDEGAWMFIELLCSMNI
jgi:hypothetical protein